MRKYLSEFQTLETYLIYLKQNNFLSDIEESYGKKIKFRLLLKCAKTSKTSKAKVLYYYTCNCLGFSAVHVSRQRKRTRKAQVAQSK